jgi:hypothetical protein
MSPRARIGLVVGAVAVLIVAFVIAQGGGDDNKSSTNSAATTTPQGSGGAADTTSTDAAPAAATTTTTTTPAAPAVPTITVVGGKPKGGVEKLKFTKGDTIRFKVTSPDTTGEVHFHGYDVHEDLKAGGSATFTVPAKIEGRFVVEMESSGTQIAEVEVDPS